MADTSEPDDSIYVSSSRGTKEMLKDTLGYPFGIGRSCRRVFRTAPPAFLCVYNPHPLNAVVIRLARRFAPHGLRSIYLHEPAKPGKATYGLQGRLFFGIVEVCQRLALKATTDVILPSPVAQDLFNTYYSDYAGKAHYAPILIPDTPGAAGKARRYFTMTGRFNFTKRLDAFIDAVNLAAARNEDLDFQIVTASAIDADLARLTPAARAKTRIINKPELTDAEISQALSESLAVLCLHPMVTQSGVLTVAFMNAAPVIARQSPGFTQFITHTENGWIVPDEFASCDLVDAMLAVKNNFERLSANARQSYFDLFAEKNWSANYAWLTSRLKQT
ncbi:MAG: glycosyltransferase [Deltaproteobacteria bacterium]|nr:glycosyltransferase [Deltaproteobacteria bacterium]